MRSFNAAPTLPCIVGSDRCWQHLRDAQARGGQPDQDRADAYTTNPFIADVTTVGAGRLSITGHGSGTTQLMVITASGTQAYLITVVAASSPSAARPEPGAPFAHYEGRYSERGSPCAERRRRREIGQPISDLTPCSVTPPFAGSFQA